MALLAALVPLGYKDPYGLGVLITMFTLIMLNVSWNFLLGFAGIWNFGQLAMYVMGGYGAGVAILHLSMNPWMAVIVGGIVGALIAVAIAIPTLRLFGIYTALLTFAAAEVVQLVIQNDTTGLTGGALGLPSVPGLFTSLSSFGAARAYYWLSLLMVVISVVLSVIIVRSPFGLGLRTMRESPAYAASRGIDSKRYRVLAFAASGFLAGIAGAMYTLYNGSITPSVMGLTPLSIYVAMLVLGGLGTVSGPIIGTAVVTAIEQLLIDKPGIELTVLGASLLIVVIFAPRGIAGEGVRVWRRIMTFLEEGGEDAEDPPSGSQPGVVGSRPTSEPEKPSDRNS